jgi:hypothetical protein
MLALQHIGVRKGWYTLAYSTLSLIALAPESLAKGK